jgi:arylsulfatase A-like enzyme/tetratricopeptide (TPR) repeat protein
LRRSYYLLAAFGVLLAAVFLLRARREGAPDVTALRPNIVLITVDTLRADRLRRGVTPAIDALADAGVSFEAARTVAPLTLPAHVTIMTGTLPPGHGVRENGMAFRSGPATLARVLRDGGYRTGAFVGAYVLDRRFGLSDGFEVYDDRVPRDPAGSARLEAERRGAAVADAATAWLRDAQEPFLAWIHFYDPHAPYDPPAEFVRKRRAPSAERRHAGSVFAYDGEVAYADAQVARVLDALRGRGIAERTAVAVMGDHGEGLGDHGELTHGMLAYDSTLRVPLVLAGAGATRRFPPAPRSGRIADPVSLANVAATLVRLGGLDPPDSMAAALPIFALGGAAGPSVPRSTIEIYGETEYPRAAGWHPLAVLADAEWKLILSSEPELFDLKRDPGETRNVAAERSAIVDGMSSRLRELARPQSGATPAVDPAVAERLRALGYVSGATGRSSASGPNPGTVIESWAAFERALSEVNAGKASEALAALQRLASAFPDAPVFQTTYARALMDAGRIRQALAVYRQAVARFPGDASRYHDLAVAARAAGDTAEALRAEQAALALERDHPAALNGVGLLHADAGRAADAAAAFERAANADPSNASYWANLGNAKRELGDRTAAEAAYRRALEADPNHPDAANGLGVLLVQGGRPADAVRWFELALGRAPHFHEARLNLGIAYQEAGDVTKAADVYRQLLATAPPASRERHAAQELLRQLR